MYRIKDWDSVFENNRTRELKTMQWVPIPNEFDGDGYSMIMEQENGAEIYGAWVACVNLASRCDPRGSLIKSDGTLHDTASISRITRVSKKSIDTMICFCRDKCKWLIPLAQQEGAEISQGVAEIPQGVAPRARARNGMEWNGKKGKNTGKSKSSGLTPEPSNTEPVASLQTRITDLFFQLFEKHKGTKPVYITKGSKNYPKAFQELASLNRPIVDYERAMTNGFGHKWHGDKMEPAYIYAHFNELIGLLVEQKKTFEDPSVIPYVDGQEIPEGYQHFPGDDYMTYVGTNHDF